MDTIIAASGAEVGGRESPQSVLQQSNYVTIVPVEYPQRTGRVYTGQQNSDYVMEQYNRSHDNSYLQTEDGPGNNQAPLKGSTPLYSVSQRVPPAGPPAVVSASYSNLCTSGPAGPDSGGYNGAVMDQQGAGAPLTSLEWEELRGELRDRAGSSSETVKDSSSSDVLSDKNDSITTSSVPSSINSTHSANNLTSNNISTATINNGGTSSTSSGSGSCDQQQQQILQGPVIPTAVFLHNHTAILMEIEDTPTASCDLICQAIVNCDELALNKQLAGQVFTLWMTSPLLELQMKPTHRPYEIRKAWRSLVERYSHASYNRQQRDEPKIMFQRNIFFPQHLEEKIKDQKILELLYEEARHNVLEGRYPCETAHYIMLGGIQARVELGPYNPQIHSTHYFREEQYKFLPSHVRKSSTWTWLPISSKNSAEVRLLEQFKRIPNSATNRKLMKKYLEFCWSLPFYGSAYFEGQIEQPVRGLTSLMTHQDIPVLVAINSKGLYIIDDSQCTLLLGLRFEELSWEHARPSREDDPDCLPCLFVQFMVVENGARVSKILQVFSRQASLMDVLITGFVNQIKSKLPSSADETDNKAYEHQLNNDNEIHSSLTVGSTHTVTLPSLTNKLSKLTLATFDEDGHCIGQMGSWSFSY